MEHIYEAFVGRADVCLASERDPTTGRMLWARSRSVQGARGIEEPSLDMGGEDSMPVIGRSIDFELFCHCFKSGICFQVNLQQIFLSI